MKTGKIWGETREIFSNNCVCVHRISINKSGFSSKHKHESKYNSFFVESGRIIISIWKNDYDLVDKTDLGPGESTIIKPGEFHMFEAVENSVAYEIYWVEISDLDIIRSNCGGINNG